jgi:ABC-type glycerol-3-phosphate transport system substrate-binding protein
VVVQRIATLMGVLSLIAACAPAPTAAPQPIHLILWHAYGGSLGEQFETLVGEFNATHPSIFVEPVYGGTPWTMRDKLFVAIAGDATPDLSQIDQFWSSELADAEAILSLETYLRAEQELDRDDIWEQAWETASYRGSVWSMPFSLSQIALYYNRSLFVQAGLESGAPPATWEELETIAAALTRDTNGDGATDQWGLSYPTRADAGVVYYWIAFLWQAGGELLSADGTAPRFQEAAGVDALAFWQRLVTAGSVPLAPPELGFERGQIAMTLASTAQLSRYVEALGEDLGVATLPCEKQCATGVGGANLAILAGCTHPQEAWQFIRWMSSAPINLRWSMQTGYLPLRRSVTESEAYQVFLRSEPRAATILEQMEVARTRPNIPAYAAVSRELGLAIENALFSSTAPAQALSDAADRSMIFLNPDPGP